MIRSSLVLFVGFLAWNLLAAESAPPAFKKLSEVPKNTWGKILETPTGMRDQPIFVYVPTLKKFVMASGMQSYGGETPRHYDTEEFDLAAVKWMNAYPAQVAAGRPDAGPVGADYAKARVKMGNSGPELFYKDGDLIRPGCGGQWQVTKVNYEFAYVPDNGKVYAYLYDTTICYDPATRLWQDLKAKPRTSCRIWGAMTYDPIHKELVHSGGDGSSETVGTWVYNLEKNEWSKLDFGSPKQKELFAKSKALCWQAKALLGAAANRFAFSETATEAKVDLTVKGAELSAAAGKLAGDIKAAGLTGAEKSGGDVAVQRLEATVAALKSAGPALIGKITAEHVESLRAVRVLIEQVMDAISAEPSGRARSQTVFDPVRKKIVLFGGDGLDRVLSDTWLYDCQTRTWEQKFPEKCPLPRAGHILGWLPKAGQVVLAGGYSRDWLAQEVWTYDVAANTWKALLNVPLASEDWGRQKFSQNCPRVTSRKNQVGAVNEDDVLVVPESAGPGLAVWACKIDPQAPDASAAATLSCAPGTYTFSRIDPALWEKAAKPDWDAGKRFLAELPVNQWTAVPFPMPAPGATNRWGTTAYDVDRHQMLYWGGGHATSQEDDVAHFSVLGGFWTLGYHPDDPIEIIYASVPTLVSFHDRLHVPMHAYKAYDYDPMVGKMLYLDRAYNPAVREWELEPYPGLKHGGCLGSFVAPTPKGMVAYSGAGLFRLDAKSGKWEKLPWNGPAFGGIYGDGHALRYDSKRDCLWLANDKVVFKYDMATGNVEDAKIHKPKALGQFFFWSEEVYLPDTDLLFLMNLFAKPDGKLANVAWSPADGKFYWVELPFVENGKPVEFKGPPFSWSDALRYDPELNLMILNNASARKVWFLKFDKASAKITELKDE